MGKGLVYIKTTDAYRMKYAVIVESDEKYDIENVVDDNSAFSLFKTASIPAVIYGDKITPCDKYHQLCAVISEGHAIHLADGMTYKIKATLFAQNIIGVFR